MPRYALTEWSLHFWRFSNPPNLAIHGRRYLIYEFYGRLSTQPPTLFRFHGMHTTGDVKNCRFEDEIRHPLPLRPCDTFRVANYTCRVVACRIYGEDS